ncbi:acyltransferase [Mycolicibacterium duvalii]|uniref:Acyltransferase n=1 Tax=Mycolicibacterium duvalii TaxID=39688 RepID=A0A7I7JUL6_9MYCO|nr:acyltransferase [Mycolicibacterium duvalii]
MSDRRDPALTGLRAVAALLVVATHAAFATGYLNHGYLGSIYARLEVGVSIFFALSGFLLFRPWVRAAVRETLPPVARTYARRRVRRIVPAYVATVLITFTVYLYFTPGPNPGQTWHGLLRYLTFTQIYTDDYVTTLLHPGLSQMWSMAVEASFYLALPVLACVVVGARWRPQRTVVLLAMLAALTPTWLMLAAATDLLPNSAGMWLPGHFASFAGGMVLAALQQRGARCPAIVAVPAAAAAFLLVATPLGGAILGPDPVWVPSVKALLFAAVATLALAPLVLGGDNSYRRLLASRPVVWLGEISYEIFLLHVVVMALVMHLVLDWPLFTGSMPGLIAATLAGTIPAAWLLHRVTAPQNTVRRDGSSAASARPRWETASFSSGVSSAAVRSEPVGKKIGS